jgi:hypothetical protein
MLDTFSTAINDEMRIHADEMNIPNSVLSSEEGTYTEQLVQEVAQTIDHVIRNMNDRMVYDIVLENDDEPPNFVLVEHVEQLIPDWLYQEESPPRSIVQETARITRIHSVSVDDFTPLYSSLNVGLDSSTIMRLIPIIFDFTTIFKHAYYSEPFKQSKTIKKAMDKSKNTECPITYDEIKIDDAYMTCAECKYNFSEAAIMTHLNENRSCPMCRCNWIDDCKYINNVEILITDILNVYKKEFTKNYNIIGEVKRGRYNKRWNYGK